MVAPWYSRWQTSSA